MEGGRQPSVPPKIGNLGAVAICIKPGGKKKAATSTLHTLKRLKLRNMKYQLNLNQNFICICCMYD